MQDERKLATYANGIAAALRVVGPTPRDSVLDMMRALHLTDAAHPRTQRRAGDRGEAAIMEGLHAEHVELLHA
jgi:hypothetical protein